MFTLKCSVKKLDKKSQTIVHQVVIKFDLSKFTFKYEVNSKSFDLTKEEAIQNAPSDIKLFMEAYSNVLRLNDEILKQRKGVEIDAMPEEKHEPSKADEAVENSAPVSAARKKQ